MANKNPLKLDSRPTEPTEFLIPKEHAETMIYLTIKIELKDKGWKYASYHIISYRGSDIYPNKIPEPIDLKIDYAKNMGKKKLFITSHVSRFREDAEKDTPSKIKYTLKIEAGDILLDEFKIESDHKNPSNFYAFILFKNEL
jgi:hypothetical protein